MSAFPIIASSIKKAMIFLSFIPPFVRRLCLGIVRSCLLPYHSIVPIIFRTSSRKRPAALDNTWYFFHTTLAFAVSGGDRGRKVCPLPLPTEPSPPWQRRAQDVSLRSLCVSLQPVSPGTRRSPVQSYSQGQLSPQPSFGVSYPPLSASPSLFRWYLG